MNDNSSWSSFCSLWRLCLLTVLFLTTKITAITLPPGLSVPALIAFGDSVVDTGVNNYVLTAIRCDFRPYGYDFPGRVPTGRFSDGRVPTDLLAEEFGIKLTVPAYLDPSLKLEDILTGVSFASGGSGYDPRTSQIASALSLDQQLEFFDKYIEKVKNLVGGERKDFILANSLFLLVTGSDDLANTYYGFNARLEYNIDEYTSFTTDQASGFVTKLYERGVRRIAVFSLPPVGCLPAQRTVGGGLFRDCSDKLNVASKLFNSKLSKNLNLLSQTLPGIKPVYVDIYNPLLDLVQNPGKYGFSVSDKGCCGTGLVEVLQLCNKITASVCPNVPGHVFWDSYHPTERAYKVMTSMMISNLVNQLV